MVKYLASFKIKTSPGLQNEYMNTSLSQDHHTTCNILLEFADMDLSIYFRNRNPPELSKEIDEFWKALFAIATAVKDIHNFKDKRDEEGQDYVGSVELQ